MPLLGDPEEHMIDLEQAAAQLSKLLPEKDDRHRMYYFWQVLGYWLSKPDPSITDERMRTLSRLMATRMLEKAVQQTPSQEEVRQRFHVASPTGMADISTQA